MHSFRCVIHKCKHTFTHQRHSRVRTLYVYVYECVYVGCMCMYVCVNTYKHVCVHTYKHVIHKCKRTVAAHVCSYTVARVLVQHLCSCTLLCVSMCVYVCVYTCLCVSMFVCIHTHTTVIRTYIHSGMCMCACVYVYVRSCMTDICVRMDTHTYTHIQVCTCMHAHIQTYIHPLTHTYTKIHTHTHAYIDTCIHTYNCSPTPPPPNPTPPHSGRPDTEYGNNIVPRRRVPPLRSSPTRGGRAHSRDRYRNGRNNQQRNPTTAGAGLMISGSFGYEGLRLTV
jgi:hypothetical protein